jgi:hypothetical protein
MRACYSGAFLLLPRRPGAPARPGGRRRRRLCSNVLACGAPSVQPPLPVLLLRLRAGWRPEASQFIIEVHTLSPPGQDVCFPRLKQVLPFLPPSSARPLSPELPQHSHRHRVRVRGAQNSHRLHRSLAPPGLTPPPPPRLHTPRPLTPPSGCHSGTEGASQVRRQTSSLPTGLTCSSSTLHAPPPCVWRPGVVACGWRSVLGAARTGVPAPWPRPRLRGPLGSSRHFVGTPTAQQSRLAGSQI